MILWALIACHAPESPREHRGGIALGLFSNDAQYDYGPLVHEISETGATDLLIAVPWSVPSVNDHAVRQTVPRDVVRATMDDATHLGLSVTVMPLITPEDRSDGAWRGEMVPNDRQTFWTNYSALLLQLTLDAERAGAQRVVVGSEMNALEDDPTWRRLAADTQEAFSGTVTYSANWDRYAEVPFWDAVDEVAVTAYFPVVDETTWSREIASLHAFARAQGRPLVISEFGYPALSTAPERPWDETTGGSYAPQLQDRLLHQALTALACQPPKTHFLWNWFGTGEADEASFTVRNRPASLTVSTAMTRPSCPELAP